VDKDRHRAKTSAETYGKQHAAKTATVKRTILLLLVSCITSSNQKNSNDAKTKHMR